MYNAFASGNQVDVICIDFKNAFDRVSYTLLMNVLVNFGFGGPLLFWFNSYLNNRKQYVKTFGINSAELFNMHSGVLLGGYLSSLLFTLFINIVKNSIENCQFLLFADDLKLFMKICPLNDRKLLQNDLNTLAAWAYNIGLVFNIAKCHSMSF